MDLKILSYEELYGWTMDRIVGEIGKTNNCTFCGVFRRQALDRGAKMLEVNSIATGHNADDIAETVIMNILRGDTARLSRCTNIKTVRILCDPKHWRQRKPNIFCFLFIGRRRRWGNTSREALEVHIRKGNRNVCPLQEIGLLLNRMYLCAERIPWPCASISKGLGKGATICDNGHHPFGRAN